jgi:hypothetical protein
MSEPIDDYLCGLPTGVFAALWGEVERWQPLDWLPAEFPLMVATANRYGWLSSTEHSATTDMIAVQVAAHRVTARRYRAACAAICDQVELAMQQGDGGEPMLALCQAVLNIMGATDA